MFRAIEGAAIFVKCDQGCMPKNSETNLYYFDNCSISCCIVFSQNLYFLKCFHN